MRQIESHCKHTDNYSYHLHIKMQKKKQQKHFNCINSSLNDYVYVLSLPISVENE